MSVADTAAGSRIITVLEAVWAEIQERHPDVPDVVLITGSGIEGQRRTRQRWGHFGPDHWRTAQTEGGGRLSEMFLAGEALMGDGTISGGRRALKTLLHEACHGIAHVRRIQDTSRQGRYHNKEFLKLAVELGLTPPAGPDKILGFSAVTLEDDTAATWADAIKAIDEAALPYLELYGLVVTGGTDGGDGEEGGDGTEGKGGKTRTAGKRIKIGCQCPEARQMPITPKLYAEAPILCGRCKKRFKADDDWEEELGVTWDDEGNEIED